jgi:hypothetical protein
MIKYEYEGLVQKYWQDKPKYPEKKLSRRHELQYKSHTDQTGIEPNFSRWKAG